MQVSDVKNEFDGVYRNLMILWVRDSLKVSPCVNGFQKSTG